MSNNSNISVTNSVPVSIISNLYRCWQQQHLLLALFFFFFFYFISHFLPFSRCCECSSSTVRWHFCVLTFCNPCLPSSDWENTQGRKVRDVRTISYWKFKKVDIHNYCFVQGFCHPVLVAPAFSIQSHPGYHCIMAVSHLSKKNKTKKQLLLFKTESQWNTLRREQLTNVSLNIAAFFVSNKQSVHGNSTGTVGGFLIGFGRSFVVFRKKTKTVIIILFCSRLTLSSIKPNHFGLSMPFNWSVVSLTQMLHTNDNQPVACGPNPGRQTVQSGLHLDSEIVGLKEKISCGSKAKVKKKLPLRDWRTSSAVVD